MDQLSTMTAVTSFIDDDYEAEPDNNRLNVQNLIVISNDPSPELRRRRRSDTGNLLLPYFCFTLAFLALLHVFDKTTEAILVPLLLV